ncbi:thioredoxin, partial [Burkholderia mallei]|nr:thioredoxin [Burkholderia mallei]
AAARAKARAMGENAGAGADGARRPAD